MANQRISINDRVKVVHTGQTYPNYSDMFESMGFKNTKLNKSFNKGEVATVFGIEKHPEQHCTLYALVTHDGRECLIHSSGVQLVENNAESSPEIVGILSRLSKIEAKLESLSEGLTAPEQSKTPVEWLVSELLSYDWSDSESRLEVCMTLDKFAEIKGTALQMEKQYHSK